MTTESADTHNRPDEPETPTTGELDEPSTEKAPGEEPKAPAPAEPEPSHEAVGIGVIGRPLVEPEPTTAPAPDPTSEDSARTA
jgi:hypothetical protein